MCESFDRSLRWGLFGLGFFHNVDDSRNGRVSRRPGDFNGERSELVEGSGIDGVTRAFRRWKGLSGDRRFIDG